MNLMMYDMKKAIIFLEDWFRSGEMGFYQFLISQQVAAPGFFFLGGSAMVELEICHGGQVKNKII